MSRKVKKAAAVKCLPAWVGALSARAVWGTTHIRCHNTIATHGLTYIQHAQVSHGALRNPRTCRAVQGSKTRASREFYSQRAAGKSAQAFHKAQGRWGRAMHSAAPSRLPQAAARGPAFFCHGGRRAARPQNMRKCHTASQSPTHPAIRHKSKDASISSSTAREARQNCAFQTAQAGGEGSVHSAAPTRLLPAAARAGATAVMTGRPGKMKLLRNTRQSYIQVDMLVTAAGGEWPADPPKAGAGSESLPGRPGRKRQGRKGRERPRRRQQRLWCAAAAGQSTATPAG